MSLILSIDTALGETSLALSRGEELVATFHHPARDQQAKMLVPWIETLLKEHKVWYRDLQGIAVSIGPGGFTGIRIGLATARALAFAAHKPIAGFSTLEILACHANQPEVTAVLPAGRGMVFHQQFAGGKPASQPQMLLLEPHHVRGTFVSSDPAQEPKHLVPIKDFAQILALLTARHPERFNDAAPAPLYIRPPDAKPQKALVE